MPKSRLGCNPQKRLQAISRKKQGEGEK
jgi:hypothetical protein